MDVGKLPNELLARLLARIQRRDPRVLLGPGIGRDAAVIDAGGERLLVAKSDPVTFASDHIGWYAVHVNANDVACMGARPAWFLATVLLPQGANEDLAGQVFGQVLEACQGLEVELATWEYGEVAEILHVGPYSEETPTIERLHAFIGVSGYEIRGDHEEEYLRGPGMPFIRVSPEDYYTIIRYQVRKAR